MEDYKRKKIFAMFAPELTPLMKYHYQYVSKTTVRIELIPEDRKETALVEKLSQGTEDDEQLQQLFWNGLQSYSKSAAITQTNFMNFPKVALCSFSKGEQHIESLCI